MPYASSANCYDDLPWNKVKCDESRLYSDGRHMSVPFSIHAHPLRWMHAIVQAPYGRQMSMIRYLVAVHMCSSRPARVLYQLTSQQKIVAEENQQRAQDEVKKHSSLLMDSAPVSWRRMGPATGSNLTGDLPSTYAIGTAPRLYTGRSLLVFEQLRR